MQSSQYHPTSWTRQGGLLCTQNRSCKLQGHCKLPTLTNGASMSFASRRAISVLPHPVGPIISMFFGTISSCMCKRMI